MEQNLKIPIMKTINEVAQLTGLAKYQIRQLVLNNKVKYVTSGKKVLINMYSLIDYLNNGEILTKERIYRDNNVRKFI